MESALSVSPFWSPFTRTYSLKGRFSPCQHTSYLAHRNCTISVIIFDHLDLCTCPFSVNFVIFFLAVLQLPGINSILRSGFSTCTGLAPISLIIFDHLPLCTCRFTVNFVIFFLAVLQLPEINSILRNGFSTCTGLAPSRTIFLSQNS